MTSKPSNPSPQPPRYRWPWLVLAAVILAILLAVLWVSREVERTRRLREWNTPSSPANTTNQAR